MNDKQVENLFVTMIDDSYLHDKLTLNDVSSLTLEKAYITPAYYSSTKKIVMTEEMMYPIYLAHEFGHYLFDYLDDDDLERASTYVSKAQDNFTTSYISDTIIDDNYRFINKRMAELLKEQDEKIRLDISSLYQDGNIEELASYVRNTIIHDYNIKSVDTETLDKIDQSVIAILNNNGEKQVKNYIYVNYGKKLATTKAQVLLDKEEPKGLSMMFDLFSSLNDGKYYNLPFTHDASYYQKNDTLAFNEQFANYTALKLTNCQENLDNVRKVLGDEYTSFMDSLLTKSLTKLGVKQDMADIDSSRYTSNSKANNCL